MALRSNKFAQHPHATLPEPMEGTTLTSMERISRAKHFQPVDKIPTFLNCCIGAGAEMGYRADEVWKDVSAAKASVRYIQENLGGTDIIPQILMLKMMYEGGFPMEFEISDSGMVQATSGRIDAASDKNMYKKIAREGVIATHLTEWYPAVQPDAIIKPPRKVGLLIPYVPYLRRFLGDELYEEITGAGLRGRNLPKLVDRLTGMNVPGCSKRSIVRRLYKEYLNDALRERSRVLRNYERNEHVPVYAGGLISPPVSMLSYVKGFESLALDMADKADEVKAACDAITEGLIDAALLQVKYSRVKRIGFYVMQESFMSNPMYEKFGQAYITRMAEAFQKGGCDIVYYCGGNWDAKFQYVLDWPRQSGFLHLDGSSDMPKARGILGDHMALMGDFPPALLAFGKPEEVLAYGRNLIRKVGKTGLVLAPGGEAPPNAKMENMRMINQAASEGA